MARIFYYVAIAYRDVHVFGSHWDRYVQNLYRESRNYLLIATSRERLSENNIEVGLGGITIEIETPHYGCHYTRAITHVSPEKISELRKRRHVKVDITEVEDLEGMLEALRNNHAAEERQRHAALAASNPVPFPELAFA